MPAETSRVKNDTDAPSLCNTEHGLQAAAQSSPDCNSFSEKSVMSSQKSIVSKESCEESDKGVVSKYSNLDTLFGNVTMDHIMHLKFVPLKLQSTSNANPCLKKETIAESPMLSQSDLNPPVQQLPVPQVEISRKGHKKAKQKPQNQSHSDGVEALLHMSDDDAARGLLARTGFACDPLLLFLIVLLTLQSVTCDCSTAIWDSSGIGPPHSNLILSDNYSPLLSLAVLLSYWRTRKRFKDKKPSKSNVSIRLFSFGPPNAYAKLSSYFGIRY